jgi:uracil-DNA glycosylase
MPAIRLTLLVGGYALTYVLGKGAMTDRVSGFRAYLPRYFPLPRPSWRTTAWERKHPWFQADAIPALREVVGEALGER